MRDALVRVVFFAEPEALAWRWKSESHESSTRNRWTTRGHTVIGSKRGKSPKQDKMQLLKQVTNGLSAGSKPSVCFRASLRKCSHDDRIIAAAPWSKTNLKSSSLNPKCLNALRSKLKQKHRSCEKQKPPSFRQLTTLNPKTLSPKC